MSESKKQGPANIYASQYRVTVQGGRDLTQEIIEGILGKQKNIANIDIVKIYPVNYEDSDIINEVKNLDKAKSIKQLFDLIQKVQPDLQPELKRTLREILEIENGASGLIDRLDKASETVRKNNEALEETIKVASEALRRPRDFD